MKTSNRAIFTKLIFIVLTVALLSGCTASGGFSFNTLSNIQTIVSIF